MHRFEEEGKVLHTVLDREYPTHGLGQLCSKKTLQFPQPEDSLSNLARGGQSVT